MKLFSNNNISLLDLRNQLTKHPTAVCVAAIQLLTVNPAGAMFCCITVSLHYARINRFQFLNASAIETAEYCLARAIQLFSQFSVKTFSVVAVLVNWYRKVQAVYD